MGIYQKVVCKLNMLCIIKANMLSLFSHHSYLRNFVDVQNSCPMETDVRSHKDSSQIFGDPTFVVRNESALGEGKPHGSEVSPTWTKMAIIDVKAQRDIGQDLRVFIDLLESKY